MEPQDLTPDPEGESDASREVEIPKEILEWEGPWPMTVVGKMDFKVLQKALEEGLAGR